MNKEEVIAIANRNNGYLYSDIVKEYGIPTVYISRLVKEKKLEKVYRGIYITPETVADELFIYSIKYPRIIYSGASALLLNGLSNKQYTDVEVTIPYGVNVPNITDVHVTISRKNTLSLGVEEIKTPFGNTVRSYDKERVICDLFLRADHYDSEDRNFAIKEYAKHFLNLERLYEYAKALNVYEKVKSVFEVISLD